ncbi:MAG TPA: hypothetical protein VJV79_23175 [Polyangiaceae bacterium]|nr:hypothetical protein [Polyangiaceae bacterium]
MSVGKWLGTQVMLGLVCVGAIGCSQGDLTVSDGAASEMQLLFKDPSTSGPRMDVYSVNGHLAVSVSGSIGTEAQAASFTEMESLEKLYLAVHPDATAAPAELAPLSKRVRTDLGALSALPRSTDVLPPAIEKSQSSYLANACRTFTEGSYQYVPLTCNWSGSISGLLADWTRGFLRGGDRTYAWNATPYSSHVRWDSADGVLPQLHYQFAMTPYTWQWLQVWDTSRSGWVASIQTDPILPGELGITQHRLTFIVK